MKKILVLLLSLALASPSFAVTGAGATGKGGGSHSEETGWIKLKVRIKLTEADKKEVFGYTAETEAKIEKAIITTEAKGYDYEGKFESRDGNYTVLDFSQGAEVINEE